MQLRIYYILLLGCFFVNSIGAQEANMDEMLYQTDTLSIQKKLQVVGIPVIFYTPETSFGLGGGAQFFLLRQTSMYNSRLSNILATVIYTANNQLIIEAKPQLYLLFGDIFIDGKVKYRIFPNSFWGIGNNSPDENLERYNMESIEVKAAVLKRIPPELNFGFEYRYERYKMLEIVEGGLLDSSNIVGAHGATISGLSFVFNLDDRDNVFSPNRGNFMQLNAGFSAKVLGASHSFNRYTIDIRKYFALSRKMILAAQIYLQDNFGQVPFQNMSWLGGGERTRGYFNGRYMDNHMYSLQTEFRFVASKRLRLAAFASVGEVAGTPDKFGGPFHYSYGGGLRFQIMKSNPSLVRLDFGLGRPGNSGIYFGVNEAF